jgi:hypothetical protein
VWGCGRPELLMCTRETLRTRFMTVYRMLGDTDSKRELQAWPATLALTKPQVLIHISAGGALMI